MGAVALSSRSDGVATKGLQHALQLAQSLGYKGALAMPLSLHGKKTDMKGAFKEEFMLPFNEFSLKVGCPFYDTSL